MPESFDQKVRQLFEQASEKPVAERTVFLQAACHGDQALYAAVQRLLAAQADAGSFLCSALQPVHRIGRYVIQGELGRGGMGIVYDAHDPMIGRNVAVKVINLRAMSEGADEGFLRERLFREARSCGKLLHPGIVIVFDVGQAEESAFIAMERVEGPSLHSILSSGTLIAPKEALRMIGQTAAALDFAHAHGIVHRDIKPGEHYADQRRHGEGGGFRHCEGDLSATTTVTQAVMGTPSYMSPEQIEARDLDGRSDQFSLAVLSYELLTGTKPFQGESIATIAHEIIYGVRPSARAVNASLPAGVDGVFERAFSRLGEDRFASCAAFAESSGTAFAPGAAAERMPNRCPRNRPHPFLCHRLLRHNAASDSRSWFPGSYCFVAGGGGDFYFQRPARRQIQRRRRRRLMRRRRWLPRRRTVPRPRPQRPLACAAKAPPVIKKFRADPDSVKTGTPAMLVWDVAGADKITIDHGVGKVAAKGMFAVIPTVSTNYVTHRDRSGRTARKVTAVDVTPDPESVPALGARPAIIYRCANKRQDGQIEEAAACLRIGGDGR